MKHLLLCALPLLTLTSCALNAPVKHARDLSAYKTLHVPAQPGAPDGLAEAIASQLGNLGFQSSASAKGADGVIAYRSEPLPGRPDHLQKLVVQVRDAKTGAVVTTARSDQPASLMPAANADMVALALRNLVAATPGPRGHPRGSLMERETLLW